VVRAEVFQMSFCTFIFLHIFIQHLFRAEEFQIPHLHKALSLCAIFMKYPFLNIIFLTFLVSCSSPSNPTNLVEEARKEFKKQAKEFNDGQLAQDKLRDSLYSLARFNFDTAITALDKLIYSYPNQADFYYIKGDIYLKHGNFEKAKDEFSKALNIDFVPKYLDSRAKCFVGLHKLDSCYLDLKSSKEMNFDGNWLIGNLYEIKGNIDSAKFYYALLAIENKTIYKYCQDRIDYLNSKKPKLFKQLVITDTTNQNITLQE
jgi:tetratricopeptide (TPR) repeat protein